MLKFPKEVEQLTPDQQTEFINDFYTCNYLNFAADLYAQLNNYSQVYNIIRFKGENSDYAKTNELVKTKIGFLMESMKGILDGLYNEMVKAQKEWLKTHIAKEPVKEPIAKEPVKEPIAKEPVKEPIAKEPACDSIVVEPEPVTHEPEPEPEPIVEEPVTEEPTPESSLRSMLKTKATKARARKKESKPQLPDDLIPKKEFKPQLPDEINPAMHAAPSSFLGKSSIVCDRCGRLKARCICARDA